MEYGRIGKWKLVNRTLAYGVRTLVMGILNVTPDSFSDGGRFFDSTLAIRRAEQMLQEGADIIDVGGESTRPGASQVPEDEEIRRVAPVIRKLAIETGAIISVDTTKASVAAAAIDEGAEIINDISGLRFDPAIGEVAASARAGLILMHSRGTMETMHRPEPANEIIDEVIDGLRHSITEARVSEVCAESIAVDPGIGFGKTFEQNLQLLADLSLIAREFSGYPLVLGTSRKRFIGRLLGDLPTDDRLAGTMATVTAAVLNGADIVRVHDVRSAVQTVRVADALKRRGPAD